VSTSQVDPISTVYEFMNARAQKTDTFNSKVFGFNTGVQLCVIADKIRTLSDSEPDAEQRRLFDKLEESLRYFSERLMNGYHQASLKNASREQLVLSDVNATWYSISALLSCSTDSRSAFKATAEYRLNVPVVSFDLYKNRGPSLLNFVDTSDQIDI
jgi:hypothetical protein